METRYAEYVLVSVVVGVLAFIAVRLIDAVEENQERIHQVEKMVAEMQCGDD